MSNKAVCHLQGGMYQSVAIVKGGCMACEFNLYLCVCVCVVFERLCLCCVCAFVFVCWCVRLCVASLCLHLCACGCVCVWVSFYLTQVLCVSVCLSVSRFCVCVCVRVCMRVLYLSTLMTLLPYQAAKSCTSNNGTCANCSICLLRINSSLVCSTIQTPYTQHHTLTLLTLTHTHAYKPTS